MNRAPAIVAAVPVDDVCATTQGGGVESSCDAASDVAHHDARLLRRGGPEDPGPALRALALERAQNALQFRGESAHTSGGIVSHRP